MNHKERKSLQYQYILFTGVLLAFIIIGVLYSRSVATEQYQNLAAHRNQSFTVLIQTTELRDHINTISNSIDIVMLEPEFKDQINLVFSASFNESNAIIKKIRSNGLIIADAENDQLDQLSSNMKLLNEHAHRLFDIRTNINMQYPSMAVSENEILPARDAINLIFNISIDEAEDESLNQSNIEAYELLVHAQKMWGDVISTYRLYLANKFGAVNDSQLDSQEHNVDLLLSSMFELTKKLQERVNDNEYSFETTEQLKTLSYQLNNYLQGFTKVKKIHHSDSWRADASFMRNTILPVVNKIIENLRIFDNFIYVKNKEYVKGMALVSEQQSFYLAVMVFIFVTYSLLVFIFLKRLVFNPLEKFSSSIRSQAFSLDEKELIRLAYTKETFFLVDSFIEMHHQSLVHRNELTHQAMHDSLTGLPNRKALMISLDQNIKVANRDNKSMSFLMLDLNKFKEVNDTLGHHIGDQLLIKVGDRIKLLLREVDLVARLGGDEFSIVLPSTEKKDAALVASKINKSLKQSFEVAEYSLHIGASIGITEYPNDGQCVNTLMQHADLAMYHSKHNKIEYSFYDADRDSQSIEALALTQDLKRALKEKSLIIYYQPKLAVADQTPIGSEALLRWPHEVVGFVSPEHIIELAEGSGLIDDLTLFIVDQALLDQSKILKHYPELKIAINLSVHNLKNESFVKDIEKIIKKHHINASCITFEITENAMMADPEKSINMMNNLTYLGVKLSVDDFGTGFSSLAYLKKLPVSELKIDRSFVNDIETDPSDKVIVQSTIELAHNLGLSVVAEGIENKASLKLLNEMNCDVTQGYYFSKPLPYEQYAQWLKEYKPNK